MMKISIIIALMMYVFLVGCVNIYNSPQENTPKHRFFESPDMPNPEMCTLPAGIACMDFRYTRSAIELNIQNGAGFNMTDVVVGVEGCDKTDMISKLVNSQTNTFIIECPLPSSFVSRKVLFKYTNEVTGIEHIKEGEVKLKVS